MASEKTLYVQKSGLLNGVLRYSTLDDNVKKLFSLDSYNTLVNRDKINELAEIASQNNIEIKFEDDDARQDYDALYQCSVEPYEVDSPFLEDHQLFPFQHVGLNYVWKQLHSPSPRVLVQWDTGAGKTLLSCLTSQKLFDAGDVDMVLVFCKKIKQYDWEQEFRRMTHLSVERIGEKMTRAKRHKFYQENKSQVLVLNYEKVREGNMVKVKGQRSKVRSYDKTDLIQVLDMIEGKRVLI